MSRHWEGSIQCNYTNQSPTKAQGAQTLQSFFKSEGVITVPGGANFLLLVPPALTNGTITSWVNPSSSPPDVPPFIVRDQTDAARKYAELTGRRSTAKPISPEPWIYLHTLKPVSKTEAIYAINTILAWNGYRIVNSTTDTFTIDRTATAPGPR
jgi:hypothetical protein